MVIPISPAAIEERVCVVIPMYRVAPYIQQVIRSLPDWVWRIVAVDDASPDDSAAQAEAVGDPRLVLVRCPRNLGVGGAVLAGMSRAVELGATVIVKLDGDGQMPVEYLDSLARPVLQGQADYVKGNRFYHTGEIGKMPFVRRSGNIVLSFLTKMASGYWNVFDPTNGFIAIDAGVFQRIEPRRIHPRYFFESSMLVELNLMRAVIAEVTMPACYAGEVSSLSIPRALFDFSRELFKSFFRRVWLQYFVLDFSVGSLFIVMGLLLAAFGLAWGGFWWAHSISSGQVASTGTVMLAVVPFILGFQLVLQSIVFDVQNVPRKVISRLAGQRSARGGTHD